MGSGRRKREENEGRREGGRRKRKGETEERSCIRDGYHFLFPLIKITPSIRKKVKVPQPPLT